MENGDFFKKIQNRQILSVAYKGRLKSVSEETKNELLKHSDELSKIFHQTAKFGKLMIDETNSLFAISRSGMSGNLVLSFDDIDSISIVTTNVSNKDNKNIFADAQLEFTSLKFDINTEIVIKNNLKCQKGKPVNGRYVEFGEPNELSIFRSIINQAISNNVQKELKSWKSVLNTEKEYKTIEAEIAFVLPNVYTKEMVEERYELLKTAFESISDKEPECIKRIHRYYQVLMSENNKYLQ